MLQSSLPCPRPGPGSRGEQRERWLEVPPEGVFGRPNTWVSAAPRALARELVTVMEEGELSVAKRREHGPFASTLSRGAELLPSRLSAHPEAALRHASVAGREQR